jgi:predicted lipoprotein
MTETQHTRNVTKVLEYALHLAEQAGSETDAARRAALVAQSMDAWRVAQRLRRGPDAR